MGKLTKHAQDRIKQRVRKQANANNLLRRALTDGQIKECYVGEFYDYLVKKSERGAKIKVYKENIYIVSKNSNRLITVYGVPDKYKPLEQYEIDPQKTTVIYFPYRYIKRDVIVLTNDGTELKGNLIDINLDEEKAIAYILKTYDTEEYIETSTEDIRKISFDYEKMSLDLFGKVR